jgi:hypothetical protein
MNMARALEAGERSDTFIVFAFPQNHHCFFFAEFLQVGAAEAQGQTIEQVHDESGHDA